MALPSQTQVAALCRALLGIDWRTADAPPIKSARIHTNTGSCGVYAWPERDGVRIGTHGIYAVYRDAMIHVAIVYTLPDMVLSPHTTNGTTITITSISRIRWTHRVRAPLDRCTALLSANAPVIAAQATHADNEDRARHLLFDWTHIASLNDNTATHAVYQPKQSPGSAAPELLRYLLTFSRIDGSALMELYTFDAARALNGDTVELTNRCGLRHVVSMTRDPPELVAIVRAWLTR